MATIKLIYIGRLVIEYEQGLLSSLRQEVMKTFLAAAFTDLFPLQVTIPMKMSSKDHLNYSLRL